LRQQFRALLGDHSSERERTGVALSVLAGGKQLGTICHGQPARSTWKMALMISRIGHSRGGPVWLGGGRNGAMISPSASVRSLP
jgi:hypothetical protein